MTALRTLLLLRHAEAEGAHPGGKDADRRLTPNGLEQARGVGVFLRSSGLRIDAVMCSSAVRARQTLEQLDLTLEPDQIEVTDGFYNAGADSLIEAVHALPDGAVTALLVGHAPGLPSVAYELADANTSARSAVTAIEHRFPAATLARLEWEGIWSDPGAARLISARLPTQTRS